MCMVKLSKLFELDVPSDLFKVSSNRSKLAMETWKLENPKSVVTAIKMGFLNADLSPCAQRIFNARNELLH